jgi:adenylate cyclase
LTPNDPRLIAQRGINSTYIGEPEAALPWIEQAMRVDPFSAHRYETDLARAFYAGGRASDAINVLGRSTRSNYSTSLLRAVCHVELGDDERGAQAVTEALSARPDLSVGSVMEGQPWKQPADTQRMAEALLRAGLPR